MKSCYPYYKLQDVGTWERWVIGNYDTCSYYNSNGFQTFGICCTNAISSSIDGDVGSVNVDEFNGVGAIKEVEYVSWPPPIPTHPPDHTPATHPPSYGIAGAPIQTTTTKPTTRRTSTKFTRPTSTRPSYPGYPNWPPTSATHPPAIGGLQTTTQAPSSGNYPISDGSCGSKNAKILDDQTKIVGGEVAGLGEWPWIAVLFQGSKQFCGGSLIDSTHILTAAHCIAQ